MTYTVCATMFVGDTLHTCADNATECDVLDVAHDCVMRAGQPWFYKGHTVRVRITCGRTLVALQSVRCAPTGWEAA